MTRLRIKMTVLATAMVFSLPSLVTSEEMDAASLMENVIEHLKGPLGKTIVGEGTFKFPGGTYLFLTAHGVNTSGREGVHLDLLSPTADGMTGLAGSGRQWRIIRDSAETPRTITFLPSLRRGRIVPYDPLGVVLGSEQKLYFLPLVHLLQDFSYQTISRQNDKVVVKGTRISPITPFSTCIIELKQKESVYIPLSFTCEYKESGYTETVSQELSEYIPIAGAKGYWAPGKIHAGSHTVITFTHWEVQDPIEWIFSSSPALLGGRYTLTPRK